MKYIDFQKKFGNYPIINISDIKNLFPDFDHRRLFEWQKKGYIEKVINNFYIISDKAINQDEVFFIANKLYEPSYLSLEYALNYYGLIPEVVFLYTCITTKKTKTVKSDIGNFSYQNLKKNLFFGYKLVETEKFTYKIAEPEKALLDFLYLRSDIKNKEDIYELRINEEFFGEKINLEKLDKYLKVFSSKTLEKKVKILLKSFK